MKCSYGVQYESKCSQCVEEALAYIRTHNQNPPPRSSPEARRDFFNLCYKQSLGPKVWPTA